MLAENQVHAFLDYCEAGIGRRLEKLRQSLKSKHKNGPLWELTVLYVSMRMVLTVDHEPKDATPDVLISPLDGGPVWLEARHISSRDSEESDRYGEFLSWIHGQLEKAGLRSIDFVLDLRAVPPMDYPRVPAPHAWKESTRSGAWDQWVAALRRKESARLTLDSRECWCCVEGTFRPNRYGYLSSGFPVPVVVDEIRKHAVYRAIEAKALQARKWLLGDEPLVLCVANTHQHSFFERKPYPAVGAQEACLAALYDVSKWHPILQANHVPSARGQNHRVPGASRISGVVLVSIEDTSMGPLYREHRRLAKAKYIRNDAAEFPLSSNQERVVRNLPFNRIYFGHDAEIERAIAQRLGPRRSSHAEKTMTNGSDGSARYLEIPQQDLTWLLSGKFSAEEWLKNYGHSDGVRKLLAEEPPLIAIELLPGDAERRIVDRVRLTFGPARERLY